MLNLDSETRRAAAVLAALAGYVDAVGYLSLGGFFVSFMSGNSTRLAVGAAALSRDALEAVTLIGLFVLGVAGGTVIARGASHARRAVIGCVAAIIGFAALLASAGFMRGSAFALAVAMGAENSAFVGEGGLPVGLTYMTGTLVKVGQQIGLIRSRDQLWQWWPYAAHWLALVCGAIGGAWAFRKSGPAALWPAAALATYLAIRCNKSTDAPAVADSAEAES